MVTALVLAAVLAGCSSGPAPKSPEPPAAPGPGAGRFVGGVVDTVASLPGSPDAPYYFKFRMIDPGSDRFAFQDRDLSFYFRPTPDALYFQIENRQNRSVWIEWDRCTFTDTFGNTGKVAHGSTLYRDRLSGQAPIQILGLQRFSDYAFPIDYLIDPAGRDDQVHRPLFPQDQTALQYMDREFAVTLVFRFDSRYQPYSFRFKVSSVIAR